MMRWIVARSLEFRFIVVFLAAFLMLYGITRLGSMPVEVFPEFAPPRVEIQTQGPGMSTTEVEELITIPLEQVMSGTPGLAILRSKSVPALSSVRLIFRPGTDELRARQLVQERLVTAIPALPTSAGMPFMLPPLSSTSRVMKIGMSSSELSLMDLSTIAWWDLRFKLMEVPGVANVAFWGDRRKILQIQTDPELMRAYGVTLDEVMTVTSEALDMGLLKYSPSGKTVAAGWIDTASGRLTFQHVLPQVSTELLRQVRINDRSKGDGAPLLLGDIGEVLWDTWPMVGDAVVNDGPGILMIVEKFPWGNTLDVTKGVEKALAEMRVGLSGVHLDSTIFRPATFIENAIGNLSESLLLGALLVMIVLLLFLFDWRIALISGTIIPISLMAALLVLDARGSTVNVMVLAGLAVAIGAVVDDAIVDVENVVRRLRLARQSGSTQPTARIVLDASLEVRGAIVYASLIEICALLPVFFMDGLSGSFFKPLAEAYVIAALVSPLVALTVTPALIAIMLGRAPLAQRGSPLVPFLGRLYERALGTVLRTRRVAYSTVGAMALFGVTVTPFLGQELLPSFKETDFLMHWLTRPGTSHPEMYRITEAACRELKAIPGVRNCGSHIGQAVNSDEVVGIYFTENWVSIDPKVDYDATLAAIQETVDGYPGLVRDVQTYLKERIREVLTGSSDAVVVRIAGPDLAVLRSKAEEVRDTLEPIAGMSDLKIELHLAIPHIQVRTDLAKAQQYGLKPGDIRRAAATLTSGLEVTDIHENGKVWDVVVWSKPDSRDSLDAIRQLLIDTPRGVPVRLEDVADVRIMPTPNVVERENMTRKIDVSLNVRDRDLGSVARDVEHALRGVAFPREYHAEVLGEYAERQAAQRQLAVAGAAAVAAIFFLLLTTFRRIRLATMAFFTLPCALVGGLLAAGFAGGGVLSLGSLVGLLTVLGIATRNGIMLISHYQHLEREEGQPFGPALVIRGSRERLAPILMTAFTTALALVPLIIAGNTAGHEIEHPMAIVIVGGLVTSTLLNLFVVPALYLRFAGPMPARELTTSPGGI